MEQLDHLHYRYFSIFHATVLVSKNLTFNSPDYTTAVSSMSIANSSNHILVDQSINQSINQ